MDNVTLENVVAGIIPHDNFYAIDLKVADGVINTATLVKTGNSWSECPIG